MTIHHGDFLSLEPPSSSNKLHSDLCFSVTITLAMLSLKL